MLGILLLAVAPARADPSPTDFVLPPTDLQGTWDEAGQQLVLTWAAPDDGQYTYHVYRDQKEIVATDLTTYTDAGPFPTSAENGAVYTVRATPAGSALQGSPSAPFVFIAPREDPLQSVETLFGPAPILHVDIFLTDLEWCDPVHLGIPNPNVDVNCVLEMILG